MWKVAVPNCQKEVMTSLLRRFLQFMTSYPSINCFENLRFPDYLIYRICQQVSALSFELRCSRQSRPQPPLAKTTTKYSCVSHQTLLSKAANSPEGSNLPAD